MKKQLLALLLTLFTPITQLYAAEQAAAPGMVIHADSMEHQSDTDSVNAEGKVEMSWQNMTMTADRASFNRTTQVLTATGNVVLTKDGETLTGQKLTLDTESGRAEMEEGRIFIKQGNFRARGSRLSRDGDDSYSMTDGTMTTCNADPPSWKFGASELDLTVEEYATGKHVVFYVKDIPVFYFPYMIFPAKRERQSGFLFPRFGNSSKQGLFIDTPFYWAISPSQEATFNLDIQTKRGVGLGVDYRYLRSMTSEGSAGGYLIYDNEEKKVRGQLLQYHKEQFADNLSLITSINLTSDRTFLNDYKDKSGEYNRQYYDSRLVLTKFWNNWLATAQAIYTQDFYSGSNTTTLQRAPELSLYGVREKIPLIPTLYFDMDLHGTNYYRENGMDGRRLLLEPRVSSINDLWGGRLNLSLFGSMQMRGYDINQPEPGIRDQQMVVIPKAGAELGSSFSRVYNGGLFDIDKMRHEIVPKISYIYTGEKDQGSTPLFDQLDRVNQQETVTLSLASHLGGKIAKESGTAEYRDLMTLRLLQSYSPDGVRDNLLTMLDDTRRWGDLTLESETWPHKNIRLLADLRYSHYIHRISSTATGAELNDNRGNSARISYRMVDQQVDYLETGLTLSLTHPFYLGATSRYSFEKKGVLENLFTVEYRHQCWSVVVGYQERPDNRTWSFSFNLAGLFGFGTNSAGVAYRPATQ